MENCTITISRGYGSGGRQVGLILSKKLNIPYYDNELFLFAAEESGISENLFAANDEKLASRIQNIILKKNYETKLIPPTSKKFTSADNLFSYQAYIIKELAKKRPCIFIGRAADFILKSFTNVIRVNIEAPFETCVKNVMKMYSVSEDEAKNRIKKIDKERNSYYRYHTGNQRLDPLNYDIMLNTEKISWDTCADIIIDYCHRR